MWRRVQLRAQAECNCMGRFALQMSDTTAQRQHVKRQRESAHCAHTSTQLNYIQCICVCIYSMLSLAWRVTYTCVCCSGARACCVHANCTRSPPTSVIMIRMSHGEPPRPNRPQPIFLGVRECIISLDVYVCHVQNIYTPRFSTVQCV